MFRSITESGARCAGRWALRLRGQCVHRGSGGRHPDQPHDETSSGAGGHEELYLTATGRANFTVADRKVDVPMRHDALGRARNATRGRGSGGSTTVLVIGGRPGAAMPPSPFEYWYSAIPAERSRRLRARLRDRRRGPRALAESREHPLRPGVLRGVPRPFMSKRSSTCASHLRRTLARATGRTATPTSMRFETSQLCRAVMLGVRSGYASAKVAGSGPIRSPRSSAPIMSISCSERSKSNRSKFSRIRSGVTDFGITTLPS